MTAAGTPSDPRTIDVVSRFLLPYPIASLYRLARSSHDERDRLRRSLALVEGAVQFIALVALADVIDRVPDARSRRQLMDPLRNAGFGRYAACWRNATVELANRPDPFAPEFAALVDSPWEKAVDTLVKCRNAVQHGRVQIQSEGDARRVLGEIESHLHTAIAGIQFLENYRLGVVLGLRDSGTERSFLWYGSRGGEEECEPIRLEGRGSIPTDVALLVHPATQRVLRLAPFVHWGHSSEQHGNHFWLLDRFESEERKQVAASYRHPVLRGTPSIDPAGALASAVREGESGLALDEFAERAGEWPQRFDLQLSHEAASRLADPPRPPAGDARYRFVGRLGRGAMGTVWEVEDIALKRQCALKTLHDEHARDASSVRRFIREGELLASIDHPAVARVFDVGIDTERRPFFTMELIDGPTLQEQLDRSGPLSVDQALACTTQVLVALDAIHAKGIVHRDVKPANVVLGRDGAKLIDLGIALPPGGTRGTQPFDRMGTPGFMAPEQWTGNATARTDLFAVGQLLFAALAGRPRRDAHDALATIRGDLPSDVDALIRRASSADPRDRFASAREMLDALAAARPSAAGPTASVSPDRALHESAVGAGSEPKTRRWIGRSVLVASGLALLCVGSVFAMRHARRTVPAPVCVARSDPRWDFHLREQAGCRSSGRPYPPGVAWEFEVLGDAPFDRRDQHLYRVRVQRTGQEGFVFMRPGELDASCAPALRSPHAGSACP